MFGNRTRSAWIKFSGTGSACSILMLLDSCDESVRSIWLTGITDAATGLVSLFAGLLTTGVEALIQGIISNNTDSGTTTVEAVFQAIQHAFC